jgi:hypothetical protein
MNVPLLILVLFVLIAVAVVFVIRDAISIDSAKASQALRDLFGREK